MKCTTQNNINNNNNNNININNNNNNKIIIRYFYCDTSLKGRPTKAEEAPSIHKLRLTTLETNQLLLFHKL